MPSDNYSPGRDASNVTARVVTSGPIFKPAPPDALTSGYQIDPTAYGGPTRGIPITRGRYNKPLLTSGSQLNFAASGKPWPTLFSAGIKQTTAHRPNDFRQVAAHNIQGNYGAISSKTNFGYRHQEFPVGGAAYLVEGRPTQPPDWGGNIAGYPQPTPTPKRPMWDNVLAIVYGLRILNPTAGGSLNNTTTPSNYNSQNYSNPSDFIPAGTASLIFKGQAY